MSGGGTVTGLYGVLTVGTDGSYSYLRNAVTPGGVSDVFTYTLTDGDGDTSTATLTIGIGNAPPVISGLTPEASGGDVSVNETNLADGSSPDAAVLTQTGTFTISTPMVWGVSRLRAWKCSIPVV
ncbi:MAG: hypothetical protein IPN63_10960 [Gammaproteobacteria bacterium]|nr:hypothetical protein [Gammaproteobacteria bacterium]